MKNRGGYNQHKADLNMKAHIKSFSLATAGSGWFTWGYLAILAAQFQDQAS